MIVQKFLVIISMLCILLLSSAEAQDYPDTLWVKVTFYDFHADGSNPEFEPKSFRLGLYPGMVAETLSADRKPTLGQSPFFNYNISKWFTPWQAGDFTIPVYSGQTGSTKTDSTVTYDTAFKNVVINDSLPFIHTGNGMYSFERSGKDSTPDFFWIDGKGFGNEPEGYTHNFSFTMELHTTFTFKKGMTFNFIGDDDVWAFINGKLAMDLGGIHVSQTRTISLDSIAAQYNLNEGKTFPFDFFYVERHVSKSSIKVMTNLFTPEANIRLYEKPGTPDVNGNTPLPGQYTIPAGETVKMYARVFDSTQWRPEWDSLATWELSDANGIISSGKSQNGLVTFPSGKPYTELLLTVKFINPDDPTHKVNIKTINLIIGPGKPYQVTFQKTKDIDTLLPETTHLSTIAISEQETNAILYAVIRDSAGYFIKFADQASWKSSNPAVGTVSPQAGDNSKGIITKIDKGTTQVSATVADLKPAVVDVTISTLHILLTSATTADRDGNGYLDLITLRFDSPFSMDKQSLISILNLNYNGTEFSIDSISPTNGTSKASEYRLYIHEITTTKDFQTGWTPVIKISQNADIASINDFKCTDGAGPVIGRAFYNAGSFGTGSESSGEPDTIYVTISEKVKKPSNTDPDGSFAYYQNGKLEPNAFSSIAAFNDSTAKLIVTRGFSVEPLKDSIQLVSSDGIVDLLSNKPHTNSRKTAIECGNFSLVYVPSSNPVNVQENIPDKIVQTYIKVIESQIPPDQSTQSVKGVIIGISIKGTPLKEISDGYYGKALAYDGLGNLIRSDLKVTKVNGNDYGIYWDCRNKHNRYVGSGTYLLAFTVYDVTGKLSKKTFKIGVKENID